MRRGSVRGPARFRASALAGVAVTAVAWAAALSLGFGEGAATVTQESRERFPHQEHEGLFPLCAGCHQGIETGVEASYYPQPASCAGCHDGVELDRVEWTGPVAAPSLLDFDHAEHRREAAAEPDGPPSCQSCHGGAAGQRMDVQPLEAGRCLECHDAGPGADPHLTGSDCATCHVTAAESGLPGVALAALPLPPSHGRGSFIMPDHGTLAGNETSTCATCHVQERCASCHVTVDAAAIQAIPAAPASMSVPGSAAHYPVPPSHRTSSFQEEHGRGLDAVSARATCATCHTQDDCASCHVDTQTFLAELPARGSVPAPGVGLERSEPPSHQGPFFLRGHATLASADPASCETCHAPPTCVACHDAQGPAVFHPDNFVARHASASFGGTSECASCHDVQRFCRDCHVQAGFGSMGRLGSEFHDAEPVWLLRHGQAARQELESCASCHRQKECLQCHSQSGSFRISPHAPGFDARRAWESNPVICTACHLRSPFGEGGGA